MPGTPSDILALLSDRHAGFALCENVGGYVPGVTNPNDGWADGLWEQPTTDALTAWQRDHMPHTTYWGQCWADDYAKLVEMYG